MRRYVIGRRFRSHRLEEFVLVHVRVSDDFPKETPSDVLAGMDGNDGRPAVGMLHEEMAPFLSHGSKPKRLKGPNHLAGGQG